MAHPKPLLLSSICRSCRRSQLARTQSHRTLSTTSTSQEPERPSRGGLAQRFGIKYNDDRTPRTPVDPLAAFSEVLQPPTATPTNNAMRNSMKNDLRTISLFDGEDASSASSGTSTATRAPNPYLDEPYHLNVYAHRHNTHITFTEPSRNPILSLSCGNLGLRNAQKASYDASFQLAAYTFRKMAEKQWKIGGANSKSPWLTLSSIKKPAYSGSAGAGIEVILRGYGPGREAFQKALLGTEGRMIKPLISKVTDGTRLKFGGTRSPQVRRLG
ncbi:hypothetical protein G647_06363 [Cladophialophora carrionii CBS 160.54]|uniref:Ribosomal protein S11 n=1 Tax=Cladophialophora carrionii CBS 160.54 TaxID=1279043 RepID=V9D5Y3_9EURO|nr:uncharacterized protein G647_06363 [Cladophialophora carrionii CBS 160.54]ETI22290.1 hypothetical protein G647_06363 [Cladophialophora carrionii CBS 160.54]